MSSNFNSMTRIGFDNCCIEQSTIQDIASCNYMTHNYFASDCSMKNPIDLATTQPGIIYKGGYGSGSGGCNIDDSSKLQIGTIQTNPKCRIDLFHRPFATVPFLGRGSVNPVIESQIQQGELNINKRSINQLGEESFINYYHTPLIPSINNMVNDSSLKIENDANNGWIRGGIPSRELTRDNNFKK